MRIFDAFSTNHAFSCAAISAACHFLLARAKSGQYYEFVETDANWADGGSRFLYDRYHNAGIEVVRAHLPPWHNWDRATFSSLKALLAEELPSRGRGRPAESGAGAIDLITKDESHLPSNWR